jgi:hypothetical protein
MGDGRRDCGDECLETSELERNNDLERIGTSTLTFKKQKINEIIK